MGIQGTQIEDCFAVAKTDNYTASKQDCENGNVVYFTISAEKTLTLPAVAGLTGSAYITAYSKSAQILNVDPNGSDRIILDGVAGGDGKKLISAGGVGNMVTCHKDGADGWVVLGRAGAWTLEA